MSDDVQSPPATSWAKWPLRILAFVGVLATLFVVVVAIGLFSMDFGHRRPRPVQAADGKAIFTIGYVQELEGTNLLRMDIAASRGSGGSYKSSRDDVRNILLLNKQDGRSRRILPDNNRRIGESRFLPAATQESTGDGSDLEAIGDERGSSKAPAAYYLLTVSQAENDRLDILVGTLATGQQAYVVRGIDDIDQAWMKSPTQIGLVLREKRMLYYRVIDIPSLRVTESRKIDVN